MPDQHMYERVADAVRDQIVTGDLQPGDRLPTQDALSEQYEVSRIVVRQALDILEQEGLIDRIQGLGTFVRRYQPLVRHSALHYRSDAGAPFAEESLAAERIPRYAHRTYRNQATPELAKRLNINIGDDIITTEYTSLANDEPMMIVHSHEVYAITRGTDIERPEEGPLMGAGLIDRFTSIGLRPTTVVERLRCRMPRPSEIELLQLRPGTPIVLITRTTYAGSTTVETADLMFKADKYEWEYAIKVDPAP